MEPPFEFTSHLISWTHVKSSITRFFFLSSRKVKVILKFRGVFTQLASVHISKIAPLLLKDIAEGRYHLRQTYKQWRQMPWWKCCLAVNVWTSLHPLTHTHSHVRAHHVLFFYSATTDCCRLFYYFLVLIWLICFFFFFLGQICDA